jgi:monovalent cation:proton antiporter-2 (CPA2) family protein
MTLLIGYLLVGILIGPHALGWVAGNDETRYLAEFGMVFLMFSVGLEFSLPKLATMRRVVFGLGAAQVGTTALLALLLCLALGLGWRAGLVLGGALAMSSTAILAKMLAERLELNSQHGRAIIGVLLFQDLAVVPFLILIPALAQGAEDLAKLLSFALVKAAVVLGAVLFLGQRLMRPWFHLVARQKSPELFMLNLLLFTLGLAWITERSGLSLPLGAFLAGMLISETEYRYQVEQDIRPFQDVLMGLFFVTIGMQLDAAEVATLATRGVDALDGYFSRYLPQLVLAVIAIAAMFIIWTVFQLLGGLLVRQRTSLQEHAKTSLQDMFIFVDPAKPPLKIGLMTVFESPVLSLKDQATALEVSAKAFNARGGANGSCIEVHTCDDGANIDQAVACVKTLDQAGVVATVNDQGTAGQADVAAAMVKAKIPRVASNVTQDDWADPNAYPMDISGWQGTGCE